MRQIRKIVWALVALAITVSAQQRPYNSFRVKFQDFFQTDTTRYYINTNGGTVPGKSFIEAINSRRSAMNLAVIGVRDLSQLIPIMPLNGFGSDGDKLRWTLPQRYYPVDKSCFKSDFLSRVGPDGYKAWFYTFADPVGSSWSDQSQVENSTLPNQVKKQFTDMYKAGTLKYMDSEYKPGDVLEYSSYTDRQGRRINWGKTVVMAVHENGAIAWHIKIKQIEIFYNGLIYCLAFVRTTDSDAPDKLKGCNNFTYFVVSGDSSNPNVPPTNLDEKERDKGKGGPIARGDATVIPPVSQPTVPDVLQPDTPDVIQDGEVRHGDTVNVYKDGQLVKQYIMVGGHIINIYVDCCDGKETQEDESGSDWSHGDHSSSGQTDSGSDWSHGDATTTHTTDSGSDWDSGEQDHSQQVVTEIIYRTDTLRENCDQPMVTGFAWGQGSYSHGTPGDTRDGAVYLGLGVYPTKSWWGLGACAYVEKFKELRGNGQSTWLVFGPSFRFNVSVFGAPVINNIFGGLALGQEVFEYDRLAFEMRPWPDDLPQRVITPESRTFNSGTAIFWELYQPNLRWALEARYLRSWESYIYNQLYLGVMIPVNESGSMIRAWWLYETRASHPSSILDVNGNPLYYISTRVGEDYGLQYRIPVAHTKRSQDLAFQRMFGLETRYQSGVSELTFYLQYRSLRYTASDFYGIQRGLGAGLIFGDLLGARNLFLDVSYTFFPATLFGERIMKNYELVPVFVRNSNNKYDAYWVENRSGYDKHLITLQLGYWF